MSRFLGLGFAALLWATTVGAQPVPTPGLLAGVNPDPKAQNLAWLEVAFEIPAGLHQSLQPEYFAVVPDPASLPSGWTVGEAVFPETDQRILDLPSYEGTVLVRVPLGVPAKAPPQSFTLRGQVKWQLCYDDGVCLLPQSTTFSLDVKPSESLGYWSRAVSISTAVAEGDSPFTLESGPVAPVAEEPPLLLVLLFAFWGGILLNFMPCVLPVLSIKAVSLVKQAGQDRRVRWNHAWAASAGILSSLLLLAGLLIGFQAAGAAVGWGVQFQNPWYVTGLIVLVIVFALSLFDVFQLSSPAVRQGKRQGLVGSFFSGLLTVVLATPCTAPFLGTALGVAFASPWWVILLVFGAVGVGLALPFFLVAVVPGALERLPKPGPWMDTFKGLMGFALVGTALWLLTVLLAQTDIAGFSGTLWFLGVVVLVGWLYGKLQRTSWEGWRRWGAIAVLVAAVVAAGAGLLSFDRKATDKENTAAQGSELPAPWQPFSEARVVELIDAGRPVFVDFTAEWCLTCKINEAGALADPSVLQAFSTRNVALLRGDYTNADPVIAAWLKEYHRAGVPFYALLVPGQEPIILPEVLTRDGLIQVLSAP